MDARRRECIRARRPDESDPKTLLAHQQTPPCPYDMGLLPVPAAGEAPARGARRPKSFNERLRTEL